MDQENLLCSQLMKTQKYITAVLLMMTVFISQSACGQVYYKSGTFKVLNASKRQLFPGVQGSPITTQVRFTMVLKTCARLKMDSFWMDGVADKVEIRYANGTAYDGKPLQGDTLTVICSYYTVPEPDPGINRQPIMSGSPASKPPVAHKGQMLFRYTLNNKAYYYSITDIKKGENVYAP